MITFTAVNKSYGTYQALTDINAEVAKGEVVCVVRQMKMELEVRAGRAGVVGFVTEVEDGGEVGGGDDLAHHRLGDRAHRQLRVGDVEDELGGVVDVPDDLEADVDDVGVGGQHQAAAVLRALGRGFGRGGLGAFGCGRAFGGGGHRNAAGCSFDLPLAEAETLLVSRLLETFS